VVRASVYAVTVGRAPALRDGDQRNSVDSQDASDSDSVSGTACSDTSALTSRCVARSARACRSVLRNRGSVMDSQSLGRERASDDVGRNGHTLAQTC
jgi:hypothetical protein